MNLINILLRGFCFVMLLLMFNHSFALNSQPASRDTNDLDITSTIMKKIAANDSMSDAVIKVSTSGGIVKLSGYADSNTQANTAAKIAQSTPHVIEVDNSDISIKPSAKPVADTLITTEVKKRFIQQKLFGEEDIAAITIAVETNNGVVALSGKADNIVQANTAVKVALSVPGVKAVKSSINLPS